MWFRGSLIFKLSASYATQASWSAGALSRDRLWVRYLASATDPERHSPRFENLLKALPELLRYGPLSPGREAFSLIAQDAK